MKANDYGVKAIGVKSLPTGSLKANPHNPRMLFDRADLHILPSQLEGREGANAHGKTGQRMGRIRLARS